MFLLAPSQTLRSACSPGVSSCWGPFLDACVSLVGHVPTVHCCLSIAHSDVDEDEKWLMKLGHSATTVLEPKVVGGRTPGEAGCWVQIWRRRPCPASLALRKHDKSKEDEAKKRHLGCTEAYLCVGASRWVP